jgi:DNA-binding beta-propeller fold protein YncE
LSNDGKTLLVLSSGFNRFFDSAGSIDKARSSEAVLIYAIENGHAQLTQTIDLPNTFLGLTFSPDGAHFYVSGGKDDLIYAYRRDSTVWVLDGAPITLDSGPNLSLDTAFHKPRVGALTAGIAVDVFGQLLLVANYQHDSVSLIDLATHEVMQRLDLRPGKNDPQRRGVAGGEFPLDVAISGSERAFVASVRDREIVVLNLKPRLSVQSRIPLPGQPTRLLVDASQSHLFVTVDNADQVIVFDTVSLKKVMSASTRLAPQLGRGVGAPGSNPNNLAISADGRWLYVTNGGDNAVMSFKIDWADKELEPFGAIPTGWYPSAVVPSTDGKTLFVLNEKTASGANPTNCKAVSPAISRASACDGTSAIATKNSYVWQLTHSSLSSIPVPHNKERAQLTHQVAVNNGLLTQLTSDQENVIRYLKKNIRHVIYVVKENRTYDQILGDLPGADGDPSRAQFPRIVTPNAHRLAQSFSVMDRFFCSGEVSMDGWQWSTGARTSDINEKTTALNYGRHGASYDSEGGSRDINTAIGDVTARITANPLHLASELQDPDLLPGARNEVELDSSEGVPGAGYLWSNALRAGLSVRNYGFFIDLTRYNTELLGANNSAVIPLSTQPRSQGIVVAYPSHEDLLGRTDPYFRGFDTRYPDFYRFQEWATEFNRFTDTGELPALSLVRFMNDHTGTFSEAIDGVNTPELQVADNDYALGLLIDRVAHSRYARDTLIFVIEDDAQDGPDHVDAHRSLAFIVGPYTQLNGKRISSRYTTLNVLKTIEAVLGLPALTAHDAAALPMLDVFDITKPQWSFTAEPSDLLRSTHLPLLNAANANANAAKHPSAHDAQWWAEATQAFDFSSEDKLDSDAYNRILWVGTMGDAPYPGTVH